MQFLVKREVLSNFTILFRSFIEIWFNFVIIMFSSFSLSCDVKDVNFRRSKFDSEERDVIEMTSNEETIDEDMS